MVNQVLTERQVGEIRAFLSQKWPVNSIVRKLGENGTKISARQVYRIGRGESHQENRASSTNRPGPSRALTERQVERLVTEAKSPNPPTQMALGEKFHVSQQLVSLQLKREGLKRLKKPKCHQLTETMKEKRRRRSWPLYRKLSGHQWEKFVTVDEALFHIDENGVQCEYQYVHDSTELMVREKKNFPQSIMAFVGISSRGPSKVIFVKPGAKISADYYVNKVLKPFFRDVRKNLYPDEDFIFHQDSAPSHTAKMTLEFLTSQNITFIHPDEWLPNSPDAAPCDFFLWGYLKTKIKKMQVRNLEELKKAIRKCVRSVPQNMIDNALKSWSKRLREIYHANGGHIENSR